MRLMESDSLFTQANKVIPGGVNSPVRAFKGLGIDPIFIDRGQGSRIVDTQGQSYLDFCLSWGALITGHAHPEIINAVSAALLKGTSFGAPTILETQMATLVCDLVPSIEKVRFVSSGTEAVMTALRLARGFTRRQKIIKFDGCYHGHSDAMLAEAGSGVADLPLSSSQGVSECVTADTLSLPYNDIGAFESLIAQSADQVAAVIMEPVPANMGLVVPHEGYLARIRELTQYYGIILIFDEVITGFRLGLGGAQEYFGVYPDLTCLGKIIGGGFPVGAVGGRSDIMCQLAPLGPVYQAGTLSGNPIAMTAGLSTLRYLATHSHIYKDLESRVTQFADAWRKSSPLTITSLGSMFTIFNTSQAVNNFSDAKKQDFALFKKRFLEYVNKGMYTPPSMFETSFISTEHTYEDLRQLLG